jgi:DNA ligase (NAD+)
MDFTKLRKKVLNKDIDLNELYNYKDEFVSYSIKVIDGKKKINLEELENVILLCLDFYAFSDSGKVLIPDRNYDNLMRLYMAYDNSMIIYPDSILSPTKWKFIKHEVPGLVGTIENKIYKYKELKEYFNSRNGDTQFILAPKYDGISAALKFVDGELVYAATRYDGYEGQDITTIVRKANKELLDTKRYTGYYKCELCVSNEDFNKLIKHKKYANRRSATSGIVNSPKNVNLAKYITVIPLLRYYNEEIEYCPPIMKYDYYYSPSDVLHDIENMIKEFKDKDFPYRVDGVVVYPLSNNKKYNPDDFMDNSIAYKINTNEATTTIKFGYMSIGRLGNAIPMVRVEPVEVNETIVEDVSLGSYDKYLSLNLLEGGEVIVYSAGDVIPQIKIPYMRMNYDNKPPLRIATICPYCGSKLKRYGSEYKCVNPECIRVNTGRIANFIDKMGIENFSDKSIEMLYEANKIKYIDDLFTLNMDDIIDIDGFDVVSAKSLISQIEDLKNKPIGISKLIGALGITNISEKKCRRIFKYVDMDYLLSTKKSTIVERLIKIDGIGKATAEVFLDFIEENKKLILYLLDIMTITDDKEFRGNIVFTGFRDDDWAEAFSKIGYEMSDTVNSNTVAVFSNTKSFASTKCKAALAKNIPIYVKGDIATIYKGLSA